MQINNLDQAGTPELNRASISFARGQAVPGPFSRSSIVASLEED
jgi:hypothetical protein